ncbi:MAG: amiloride-sensitive sodium channel family protein, partial [Gammaproteobacteria bacterium]|nr:amiloride-sensitive sodium channel family protein [Gammaproteobacteria bacterium]
MDTSHSQTPEVMEEREIISDEVSQFFSITTMHGLSDVYRANGFIRKLTWLLIFVAALLAAVYGCYAIVAEYVQGPVVVSYMVSDNKSLVLPDIVICPFNRFNQSFLDEYNVTEDIANYMELS